MYFLPQSSQSTQRDGEKKPTGVRGSCRASGAHDAQPLLDEKRSAFC